MKEIVRKIVRRGGGLHVDGSNGCFDAGDDCRVERGGGRAQTRGRVVVKGAGGAVVGENMSEWAERGYEKLGSDRRLEDPAAAPGISGGSLGDKERGGSFVESVPAKRVSRILHRRVSG